jgi:class 3 adenylate cyclase/tetratricopeptide (TPR) repeat protein
MHCSKCGAENPDRAKFCGECASPFMLRCPSCDTENSPTAKFCIECAKPLESAGGRSQRVPDANSPIRVSAEFSDTSLEGERKTVTMLFADIKGSMDLIEVLDPEEARAIVDPALKLMMEAVQRYGGYVAQSTGDGIFALFGAPVAHEDHPQRALFAALRLQEEMRRYSAKLRVAGNLPVEARVGVNTGEVVVRSITRGQGNVDYAPIGHSTGVAARMQALAPTGSIAATDPVRKLCEGYFTFKTLGPTKVKGVTEPVDVYEVTGFGPLRTRLQRSASHGYTKFVGRKHEMEALGHCAELARRGQGQIVAVVAEPGVGKSRLCEEFKLKNQSGWMVLEAVSVPYGKASAFLPLIDLLWSYFKITMEDDERTRREKITGRVLALDRSLEDALPYLDDLLGLGEADSTIAAIGPHMRKKRALDAVKRILLRESLNQPLMVTFEDLHWIDEETQVLLNLLADGIGTSKILMLVNYRPEYSHSWSGKTYYTQLRLDPLGRESAEEMLMALMGESKDLAPLTRLIIDKTEGNPFFMEEIYQALIEEGALVREGSAVKLLKSLNQLKIPPTVQGIVAARIDRLPEHEKEALQILAVIGKEFQLALASRIIDRPNDDLERMLSQLQLAEFIYEQPGAGDIEYTFKHAYTRDVAYNEVLVGRRKVLHGRIGSALESLYANTLDDHLAELAYHYSLSSNAEKAVEFCLRACRQYASRASYRETVTHLETGLDKLQELPDDDRRAQIELDLRIAAQHALRSVRGYASPESEQAARRTMELSQRPGVDWEKTWFALYGLGIVLLTRGTDPHAVREIGARLLVPAEERGRASLMAGALYLRAFGSMNIGGFDQADQDFERAIALAESTPWAQLEVDGLFFSNWLAVSAENLWYLGYPDRGQERVHRATAAARESGSKSALEAVHNFSGYLYQLLGDVDRLRERAEATAELATESGTRFRRSASQILIGWAEVVANDFDVGIARMLTNLAEFKADGAETRVAQWLALIAAALGKAGKPGDGLREIDAAIAAIERTGERRYEAEVYRIKGALLLVQDSSNAKQAEELYLSAIEISRKQHAKCWELRATTSLARLLTEQGKLDEARTMLAEIYNWFTEGFDTADLKDAKALLEELSNPPR